MSRKFLLTGTVALMLLGAVPAFAATNNTPTQHQAQMNNREQPPEHPKDANGNPLPPPDMKQGQNGNQPPEPPKDANGNPLPPPDYQQQANK